MKLRMLNTIISSSKRTVTRRMDRWRKTRRRVKLKKKKNKFLNGVCKETQKQVNC